MIYCVGVKENYDRYFTEQERPLKLGRVEKEGYPGGSVWKTQEAAQAFCENNHDNKYGVYGVLANWETDTTPSLSGDWHDLLYDAELIKLE
jgi:hypothetical protein